MKTVYCVLVGVGLLVAPCALAQTKGSPYLAVDAGGIFVLNTDISDTKEVAEFDPGYRVDLRLGYLVPKGAAFGSNQGTAILDLAAELNVGFAQNSIANSSLDFNQVPVLFNLALLFHLSDRWDLGFGAGVGASWTMLEDSSLGDSSSDVGLAYQGFVRASYRLTENLSLSLFCNAMSSGETSFPAGDFKLERTIGVTTGLGMSWLF